MQPLKTMLSNVRPMAADWILGARLLEQENGTLTNAVYSLGTKGCRIC